MDDDRIVDLYWERSENAISETAIKYGRYCRAIAFNILSNNQDAEECENDTYTAAWNAMPPTRPKKLLAFLGRLTRNIALDRWDYKTAKKRNCEFEVILSELGDCVSLADDVVSQYVAGEIAEYINRFLRSIDVKHRIIFMRRYWYSDSIKDISVRYHMSESKVKSMLYRTRNKLREYLEKEGVVL